MNIDYSSQFKKDYSRLKRSGQYDMNRIKSIFDDILTHMLDKKPLPQKYRDHGLKGEWKGCRECHIQNDLLLI